MSCDETEKHDAYFKHNFTKKVKPKMNDELKAIQERWEKATKGPWERMPLASEIRAFYGMRIADLSTSAYPENRENDTNFIAHSHDDIRTLLDMVKEQEELDDCVLAFARQMQFKLDKNKHKECPTMNPKGDGRGWSHCHFTWLHGRIKDELKELWDSLKNRLADPESVLNECADVGNFAMMIHDKTLKENTNEE